MSKLQAPARSFIPVPAGGLAKALAGKLEKVHRDLADREARLRAIVSMEPECVKLLDGRGNLLEMNPAGLVMIEAESFEEMRGRCVYPLVAEEHRAAFQDLTERVFRGESGVLEFELQGLKGGRRWMETHATPLRDDAGAVTALLAVTRDITRFKQNEASLLEMKRIFEMSQAAGHVGSWTSGLDKEAEIVWTAETCRIFGLEPGTFDGTAATFFGFVHPDDRMAVLHHSQSAIATGEAHRFEYRIVRRDGQTRWLAQQAELEFDGAGRPLRLVGMVQDITERKLAELALRESEERLRLFIDHAPAALAMFDREMRYVAVSRRWISDFKLCSQNLIGRSHYEVFPEIPEAWKEVHRRGLAGETLRADKERFERQDHSTNWLRWEVRPWFAPDGSVGGIVIFSEDITSQTEAEERLREIADTIEDVFWVSAPGRKTFLHVSPAFAKIWGRPAPGLAETGGQWLASVHPEDRDRVSEIFAGRMLAAGGDEEYRIVRPDGRVRWIRDRSFPVCGSDGQIKRVVGVARDVTDQHLLEEQLRHSQKMEAIGRLAGGVAHDLNNILAALMMQTELIRMTDALPDEVAEGLDQIRACAERAASLTRQMLLFGRKEVLQPVDLDLNDVVTGMTKMLRRIIGKDVRLDLELHSASLLVRADAGMLEQVLLNLAVNARDAMPVGGVLRITTAERVADAAFAQVRPDLQPGRYAWISVTDNGTGISPEILPHIFEPFFTTKEPGKGTGLGLATVFGIVKQHRGWVEVSSAPGQGTTFEILLPESIPASGLPLEHVSAPPRGGTETILLVEDESAVRAVTRLVLEKVGYRVIEAPDGVAALAMFGRQDRPVDLLLTDLVMPEGLGGQELAARLTGITPGLRVLFTSGYSAELAGREVALRDGQNFLMKPYTPKQLLEAVRSCLDA